MPASSNRIGTIMSTSFGRVKRLDVGATAFWTLRCEGGCNLQPFAYRLHGLVDKLVGIVCESGAGEAVPNGSALITLCMATGDQEHVIKSPGSITFFLNPGAHVKVIVSPIDVALPKPRDPHDHWHPAMLG